MIDGEVGCVYSILTSVMCITVEVVYKSMIIGIINESSSYAQYTFTYACTHIS